MNARLGANVSDLSLNTEEANPMTNDRPDMMTAKQYLDWERMASSRIFRIDEDLFTLDQLRDANREDTELIEALQRMAIGEVSTIGGGAFAEFTVERLV